MWLRAAFVGDAGVVSAPGALDLAATLDALAVLIPWLASSETTHFDGLDIKREAVTLARTKGRRVPEPTRHKMGTTVDAIARNVQLMT